MKSKKLVAMTMAAALTLSMAGSALAAGGNIPGSGTNVPNPDEVAANGNTTIGIMQAQVNPRNMSFEVPLYVTMAVVDGEADVAVPTNYGIKNTTTPVTGKEDSQKIGVVGMSFEKLVGSTFNTIDTPVANTDIKLTIGGVTMPTLSAAGTATVTLAANFGTATNPTAIEVGDTMALPLTGTVMAAARTEAATVAQFRVKYTLSLLTSAGAPMGSVYAGDDSYAAGLGDQTPTP